MSAEPPLDSPPVADTDRPPPGAELTEERVNSPTPLTLRLLGVIFAATFIPWVAAKTACNLREGPIRSPSDLPTEVLAKQPKSAGLELQQRAATGRYREAAELAKGPLKDELLAADARCQTEPASCAAQRTQQDHIFTRAVLVARSPNGAEVRTESTNGAETERFLLRLEVDAGRWYAVAREPYAGPLTEPPPAPAGGVPLGPLRLEIPHPAMPHSEKKL